MSKKKNPILTPYGELFKYYKDEYTKYEELFEKRKVYIESIKSPENILNTINTAIKNYGCKVVKMNGYGKDIIVSKERKDEKTCEMLMNDKESYEQQHLKTLNELNKSIKSFEKSLEEITLALNVLKSPPPKNSASKRGGKKTKRHRRIGKKSRRNNIL